MILEGLLDILQALFGWLFLVILQMLLRIVDILEKFFDVFAGTEPVYYKGEPHYLFNLFFSNRAITNLFWAMAIIAIVLSFGFCIVAVARKVTDVSGTSKHTLGQIMSNFIRSLVVILLLNVCIIAAINVTAVVFDRINYSLENSEGLKSDRERVYTDEEFATMVRIMATVGNYAANPSAESRYNVNACFNAIRGEVLTLFNAGCFDYDFPVVRTGKHTWQSALAQVAKSANLEEDLQLDTYYSTVQDAITLCFDQLKTNINFKPQQTAVTADGLLANMSTAKLIFLTSSMGAEENKQFRNGSFDDALRKSYLNNEKDFLSFEYVDNDFAITRINYVVGIIAAYAMILFLAKIILVFIARIMNVLMLYVVSPLFASSMTLDEGSRFQNWVQSFVMQLVAAYASVVMMRVYLIILPIILSSDFQFFAPGSALNNYSIYGQLLVVLAGSWAVSRATVLISGALTGNAASAVQDADSSFGNMVSWAVGTDRLYKEFARLRQNRDRAKSYAKGRYDKALRPKGAEDESAKAIKELKDVISGGREGNRNNLTADKNPFRDDTAIGKNAENSKQKLQKEVGFDPKVGQKAKKESSLSDDTGTNGSSSLDKMREEMGLQPDTFNLDNLPDLGKVGSKSGNTGQTSKKSTRTSTSTRSGVRGSSVRPSTTKSTRPGNGGTVLTGGTTGTGNRRQVTQSVAPRPTQTGTTNTGGNGNTGGNVQTTGTQSAPTAQNQINTNPNTNQTRGVVAGGGGTGGNVQTTGTQNAPTGNNNLPVRNDDQRPPAQNAPTTNVNSLASTQNNNLTTNRVPTTQNLGNNNPTGGVAGTQVQAPPAQTTTTNDNARTRNYLKERMRREMDE